MNNISHNSPSDSEEDTLYTLPPMCIDLSEDDILYDLPDKNTFITLNPIPLPPSPIKDKEVYTRKKNTLLTHIKHFFSRTNIGTGKMTLTIRIDFLTLKDLNEIKIKLCNKGYCCLHTGQGLITIS
jgi:hypothetical protein